MRDIPEHVFRGYDMRGEVGSEITPELVALVGRGFGTHLWRTQGEKPNVVVGRDLRPSSGELAQALIRGIVSTGADVADVGETPTPLANFSHHLLDASGVAVVTASHNPPEDNGLKLRRAPQMPICGDELQTVLSLVKSGDFETGKGRVTTADTLDDYVGAIGERLNQADGLRVVVDAGNGSGGQTAPAALRRIGCEVIELYCEPDGTFPNHHPDPSLPENLVDLRSRVLETGAAIGFSLDGDGDRLGVVDDKGRTIMPDTFLIVLCREALEDREGKIVIDVGCSDALVEDIKTHGGEVVLSKCGYPYLLRELGKGRDRLLGGEVTGHIFFNEPDLDFDDGTYAACRLASRLSRIGVSLSEVIDDPSLKVCAQTPQAKVPAPDTKKFQVVEQYAVLLDSRPDVLRTDTTDGVKAWYEDGWVLARGSNTTPKIVVRAEGSSQDDADRLLAAAMRDIAELAKRDG